MHRSLQATPNAIATIYKDRQRTHVEHADRIACFAGALLSRTETVAREPLGETDFENILSSWRAS